MYVVEPGQLYLELFDRQTHDHRGVGRWRRFFDDRDERVTVVGELLLEEASSPVELRSEISWAGLPRENHPGQERIRRTLRRPSGLGQRIGKQASPGFAWLVDTTLRTKRRIAVSRRDDMARIGELAERIVDLCARYARPLLDLPSLELGPQLIAVHGSFAEHREDDEVGERHAGRSGH